VTAAHLLAQATPSAPTEGRLDPSSRRFAASIDVVQSELHELELQSQQLGLAIAPLYLASARGSLRHVLACLYHQRGDADRHVAAQGELCPGSSLRLMPVEGRGGIGHRCRLSGRRVVPALGGDVTPWASKPDLGADLMPSSTAREFCRGPIGSALLFDALARHRWMHRTSGSKWSADTSGAQALVSALTAGRGFPLLESTATAGLLDLEVVELLAALGWDRILSTRMPGDGR
jgi:hypothetical protein